MSRRRPDYVIHAGKVIDGTGREPLNNAAVLIREGVIRYVGAGGGLPAHDDAIVIDASKLTVMPGLIDGDSGFSGALGTVQALQAYLRYGVTTIATFNGISPGKPPAAGLRDAVEKGILRGCSRLLVGHVVNATNGHNRGRTADGPWEIRRAVRETAEAGADFIKTAATGGFVDTADGEGVHTLSYTAEELNALVDEAHAWGLKVNIHAHSQPGLDRAIEAGADRIMHGCFMDDAAVAKMAERGTWYIPTLRITSRLNMAAFRAGVLDKKEASHDVHRAGVRSAIAKGVPIALGSHGPGPGAIWKLGESTAVELAELVECGLTPLAAIAVGTLHTARAYAIDHRVGSLEAGKQADIVCLAGDPSERIELLRDPGNIAVVFQKGRVEHASFGFREYAE
ncbi:amidohydrolase family protein [Paenibacillus hemerocallicola]|uniref:Amidohydrolase family protein n=1 Tax=Paenibacillus hemerocallicola TaxID=1172614 RepID=A0A5C4T9F9_9BACL|nr:amidohydrolase family protein [Paenibacillus hemerocallicola]TNJ65019.1 amidohydrolase family protein [Paenibacillus hemerocallicola]